ncbi:MAG TPA: hypothetical protein VIV34_08620 [Pseudolabrys sp.]
MTAPHEDTSGSGWRRLVALALCVVATGLPVNNISDYALLLILAVVIFSGNLRTDGRAWMAAVAIAIVAALGQALLAPPRIQEGHNVFLPSPALERGLPHDVYRHLAAAFDAQYPPEKRCDPKKFGCWQNNGFPDSPFAFSADGIWLAPAYSRSVSALDFSNPVWLRLGFVNELRYNWTADTDVARAKRDRRFWMGWDRWHLTMPWFEVVSLPPAYAGGELCWRGEVMWEGEDQHFVPLTGDNCRIIRAADTGKRIVGVAIKPETLAMHLTPPWSVRLQDFARGLLLMMAAAGIVGVLVRVRAGRMLVPVLIVGLSLMVIAVDDASFLGGLRPFDGGDDGLFYDGVGRLILQKLLAGDLYGALEGGENVFYYGGPGLRYFRALEHVVFGESYLGYLSLLLLFPFLAFGLFRRFLPERWSIALIFLFVAIPVGVLFGTSFVQYEQWASRGFADPAAYILFVAGILPIVAGSPAGQKNLVRAFFGALLLALGIFMKPIVAPAAAVFLGGAGIAALYSRQWVRLVGLCVGFLPVFSMALHNWVYGQVFVLFSANAEHSAVLVTPPSVYAAAARELATLELNGEHLRSVFIQIGQWLSGPAETYFTIPLNAAGVAILIYVVACGRQFEPWLRLVGGAALAQHLVALFYNAAIARYHFLAWFLTMLVVVVWFRRVGIDWLKRHFPALSQQFVVHPWSQRLASGLARLQKVSA